MLAFLHLFLDFAPSSCSPSFSLPVPFLLLFPPVSLTCLVSLAPFVSLMNAAPRHVEQGWRKPPVLQGLTAGISSPSHQPPQAGLTCRIWLRHQNLASHHLGAWTTYQAPARSITTARTMRSLIRVYGLLCLNTDLKRCWEKLAAKILLFCLKKQPPCYVQALVPPRGWERYGVLGRSCGSRAGGRRRGGSPTQSPPAAACLEGSSERVGTWEQLRRGLGDRDFAKAAR